MRLEELGKRDAERRQSIRELANEIGELEPDRDGSFESLAKLLKRLGKQLVDAGMVGRVKELEGRVGPSTHAAIIAHAVLTQAANAPLDHLEHLISGDAHEMLKMKEQWLRIINEVVPGNGETPADPPNNLTPAQLDIWNVVMEHGRRMSTSEIDIQLVKKSLGQPVSTFKQNLAILSRRLKLLPYRGDTTPKGYGLPAWK